MFYSLAAQQISQSKTPAKKEICEQSQELI